jgi:hypothetical protein
MRRLIPAPPQQPPASRDRDALAKRDHVNVRAKPELARCARGPHSIVSASSSPRPVRTPGVSCTPRAEPVDCWPRGGPAPTPALPLFPTCARDRRHVSRFSQAAARAGRPRVPRVIARDIVGGLRPSACRCLNTKAACRLSATYGRLGGSARRSRAHSSPRRSSARRASGNQGPM